MSRFIIASFLALTATVAVSPDALSRNREGDKYPEARMNYQMNGPSDERPTHDSPADNYRGRWVGTWYGDDGRVYEGSYEGSYQGHYRPLPPAEGDGRQEPANNNGPHGYAPPYSDMRGEIRDAAPNPSYIGSGKVVNGWYYPLPVTTTTTTEYRAAQ